MYRVFLSSTSRDLEVYREAVHRAIDGLPGFTLVKMEDFGARDANAEELCARLVRDCDLLVGLMGHYYGSCPPGETTSFTELEYRTATVAGLSRLMFVAPDDFPISARLRESDASFERQMRFRQEVMAERVAASFETPEQLGSAVTRALFVWNEDRRQATQSNGLAEAPGPFVTVAEPKPPLGPNPYRGLEAFRKEDAERFFGREALVEKLWAGFIALHGSSADGEVPARLLAIIGPSGCGKSSVAQAGLLAALDERPLPGRPAAPAVVFTPEAKPLESLAVALARHVTGDPAPVGKAVEFEKVLHERSDGDGLRFLAARMLGKTGIVLLVDQFEETYALCQKKSDRAAFIKNVINAARAPDGGVSIVLTLRSDFLGAANQHPELSGLIARQNVVVPVMAEDDLRRAIEEPAKAAGQEIDRSTVDLLIEQTLGREGALPALEFVLTRIWEGFRKGVSSADTVRELGGVGGALAKEAKRLYDDLSDQQKTIARRAFLAMTTLGEGTKDTRRRAAIDDMVAAGQSDADVRRVLEIFADPDRRLITLAADKDGRTTAEVAHEALFDHWSELKQWLDQDRADIRFARRVEGAVKEWADAGRPKGMLWRPPLLDLLRNYAEQRAAEMPAGQLAFHQASERQHRQGVWAWRGGIAAAIAGLLIIAGGFAAYSHKQTELAEQQAKAAQQQAKLRGEADAARDEAVRQARAADLEKQRADEQRDQALIKQSLFLAEKSKQETERGNATNGILLALQGLPRDMAKPDRPYVLETEAALYHAVTEHRELHVLEGDTVAFSPDGTRVVTASEDHAARVWDAASGKALVTLTGHTDKVMSAAFSPDGIRVVTASYDNTARLWDAGSGKMLLILGDHTAPFVWAGFSPDGTRVVTTAWGSTTALWDAATGKALLTLQGGPEGFSRDGTRLVTVAGGDHTAQLWDLATGKALVTLTGHENTVSSAAFSPDGTRMVTTSQDETARVWDAVTGKALATLEGHTLPVLSAAFSPDGRHVVTASSDNTARLWDADSGEMLATLEGHTDTIWSARFSPDGTRVLTASDDHSARLWAGEVYMWDPPSRKAIAILEGHTDRVSSARFSPDGTRVATASPDHTARMWDAATDKALATVKGGKAAFSPDGTRVVTASDDGTARLWDAASGKALATLEGHTSSVNSVAFSPDGTRVVTASNDGTARLWDAASGKALATLAGHMYRVYSAAFSPDGTRVVTASGDSTARLWDAASGKALATLEGHSGEVWSAAFSREGTQVFTRSNDNTVRVWDAATGKALVTLKGNLAAFSPDGTRVVTLVEGYTARVWDAATGKALVTLQGVPAAFSPDGTRVVTAPNDGTARLWEVATGKPLATLEGHTARVNSAAFSPDGTRVVTASKDKTARLWDATTGKELAVLHGQQSEVVSAAFSPDGTRVVTASEGQTAKIWRVFPTTQALIDYARSIVPRQLTPEQRRQFFLEAE